MARPGGQKQKLLLLQRILLERTDEDHPMTVRQMGEALREHGVEAERKCLYDDLHLLEECGLDLISQNGYYFVQQRIFEEAELSMLLDAVAAARFITEKKTNALMQKIAGLTSCYRGADLLLRTVTGVRPKGENESVLYTANDLTDSVVRQKQVAFYYFHWKFSADSRQHFVQERGRDGQLYRVSPRAVVWDDENDYLIGYDHEKEEIRHFRLDRMDQVHLLEQDAMPTPDGRPFDARGYCARHFGMFSGTEALVKLRFESTLAGAALDYFGPNAFVIPDDPTHFLLTASVAVSPRFFSWIFGFGGKVQLLAPTEAVNQLNFALRQHYTWPTDDKTK